MCDSTDKGMEKNSEYIDINLLTRYLAGESSPEENILVKKWLAASENNRKELEEFHKAWEAIDKTDLRQEINIDNEWKVHQEKISPVQRGGVSIFLRTFIRVAAALIIAFGITIVGIRYGSKVSVRTSMAETREIKLPDGSRVTLNAGSKFSYNKKNYGEENRSLSLQGEAYFEVEKNPDLPFIIQVREAEVKVLGTSFNVKAYKKMDAIEVTVSEGKISLYDRAIKQKHVVATGGERAEFDKQLGVVKKYPNADRNYISWKTRSIVFENDSLAGIAKTLSNVYHKNIILENPGLNACTLTTSFENEDLQTVLKILESTLDLEIREEKNEIIISGEGC